MRVVVVSDTHGRHEELGTLSGDVLIHCGDIENLFRPDPDALRKIDDWFRRQRFQKIFFVGGNHDHSLEQQSRIRAQSLELALFLNDAEDTFRGIKFFGSSWVPMLNGHAFFADDKKLLRAWSSIPSDVDVLITHTPPYGVLDVSSAGKVLGCKHLANRLNAVSPRLHVFGHVHASAGTTEIGRTRYVNATSVNSAFEIRHMPFVIEL